MSSEISFLFRFRDLVAKTVHEHEVIIKEQGRCWWGWWKRPAEDSRADIWLALSRATASTPITVGLFDSGSGKVYKAVVVGVIAPADEDIGAESIVTVPEGEGNLVPHYYRKSPFSRAWLKITDIQPLSNFFGEYSFSEMPKLSNYSADILKRFDGKKIIDAEELRSMDTTIWQVRPSRQQDPDEKIVLSIPAVSQAVSQEVVRCKGDLILHITDLHFALDRFRNQHVWRLESEIDGGPTMTEAILNALGHRKIGLVIASGDFSFIGSEDEFEEARVSLTRLMGSLDLAPDHLIIIPGNHDIQWGTDKEYTHDAEVQQAPASARKNYEEFYRRLMRHEPSKHLAMGRRYVLPSGVVVEVCGLNSSSLATGKKFLAGMGRVEETSFSEVAKELGWKEEASLALKILVIHHHLAVTEDVEPASGFGSGYGMAVDAVRVQRLAARLGVDLAIHGHKHRSFLWRSTPYELPEHTKPKHKLGELNILGGGSSGSSETDGKRNYFNLLDVKASGVTLEIFVSHNLGMFELMQTWKSAFQLDLLRGGLAMSDWSPGD